MDEPIVCCVMLTRDRARMAARAVESFRRQTYDPCRRVLWIIDTTEGGAISIPPSDSENEIHEWLPPFSDHRQTIGELRNIANDMIVRCGGDIIAHFDDDDWSHPNRLAEQVALLQSSGADCVCYKDMLFWDTRMDMDAKVPWVSRNQAWLYTNPAPIYSLGSSMCYLRSAWEKTPFDDINHGEDGRFMRKVKTVGVSSIPDLVPQPTPPFESFDEPRMVCGIHGGNSSPYRPESAPNSYRRVPEWDGYCRRVMQL